MRASSIAFTFTVGAVVAALAPAIPAQADVVTCRGVKATIVGTPSSEVIHGTAGRDVIAARQGSDTIFAGAGNDLVCGGYGADRLYGDAGRDRLFGGYDRRYVAQEDGLYLVGDTLHGGPGDDRLYPGLDSRSADTVVSDVLSWDASAHGVHIDMRTRTARGEGSDTFGRGTVTIVGSPHGDVVVGTNRHDRIDTGAGPDVVRAGGGSDIVVVDDTYVGPGDADQVWGGEGNDRITARQGQDRLSGGPGNDWIEDMGASNDVLIGGRGDDVFYGQVGDTDRPQSFNGGRGVDTLDLYTDRINPKAAASTGVWNMATGAMTLTLSHKIQLSVPYIDRAILVTPGTAWTVTGTSDADTLSGGSSSRTSFNGLAGDDVFRGTDGDDVFNGGPGNDQSLGMFDGDDTCTSVETIDGSDCEHVS
jgi:Ca2+-binding RTX toxin-like protein